MKQPAREEGALPRRPHAPSERLRRVGLGDPGAPAQLLREIQVPDTELHPPSPLHESLEWQISARYWHDAGLLPFQDNSVPYVVNNSGRLSSNAAMLLFENLEEHPPELEEIVVLELGAGSGLFAKLFLDAFRELCAEQSRNYYDRLTYVVSDHSPSTVEQWRKRRMFEAHSGVLLARIDALQPLTAHLADEHIRQLEAPRAVFCNYLLDVLPTTIWRKNGSNVEEMLIGTHLVTRDGELSELTSLGLSELRSRVDGDASEFLQLEPLMEPQVRFAPPRRIPLWGEQAAAIVRGLNDGERVAVNFGALDCLDHCLSGLHASGFVLVNDYGVVSFAALRPSVPQRFGHTLAMGLNFPLIEWCLKERQYFVQSPPGDAERGVHTRLISLRPLQHTARVLTSRFAAEVERELNASMVAAREHASAGRLSEALDAFRSMLEHTPRDWSLLGEAAEFIGLTVRDVDAGLKIARQAIELNPWTSPWLWNVLGDCLYQLDRYRDAHEAFLTAESIDPNDVRTHLNLAHTYARVGQPEAALTAIARGLSTDTGVYRTRLLQQQEQVLSALSSRHAAKQARLERRLEKFRAS